MREDLLNEILSEYEARRIDNGHTETKRREIIDREYPEIRELVRKREAIVFDSIRQILERKASRENLSDKMESINHQIDDLLQKAGLGKDFLSPVYSCPKCRDTGYVGDVVRNPCECLQKAYQEKLRTKIGLGQRSDETFETFNSDIIPDEPVAGLSVTQRTLSLIAKEQCEKWADSFPDVKHRDILLTGGSGLGKTFLLRAMAARLVERGQNVLLISAYSFLQMARKSYYEAENGVQELMDIPVLMLDDLGSEPLLQNVTIEQLFHLINQRQTSGLSTVISTNLTLQELRERYTERVASRLNNPKNCLVLTLEGKDLRKFEK